MQHQQLKPVVVQLIILVHHVKNVQKVMVVHIHQLVFIWDNVGHADHYVMKNQINVIKKPENVRYGLKDFVLIKYFLFFFLNRIVKVIVKVIDVNDVVQVMSLMDEAINAYHKMDINHVHNEILLFKFINFFFFQLQILVHVVHIMLIKNHMIHVVQHH